MDGSGLVRVGTQAAQALAALGGAAVVVVIAWQFLKVVVSGSDKALLSAVRTLVVVAVALAVLRRPAEVAGLVGDVGTLLVTAGVQAVRAALGAA